MSDFATLKRLLREYWNAKTSEQADIIDYLIVQIWNDRDKEFDNDLAALRVQLEASETTIMALQARIDELIPECDAAYAPYREMVATARAETDKYSTELYKAQARITELEVKQDAVKRIVLWCRLHSTRVMGIHWQSIRHNRRLVTLSPESEEPNA